MFDQSVVSLTSSSTKMSLFGSHGTRVEKVNKLGTGTVGVPYEAPDDGKDDENRDRWLLIVPHSLEYEKVIASVSFDTKIDIGIESIAED